MNKLVPLYCTLCAEQLHLVEYDYGEANLECGQGHRWWYSPVELTRGNFLVFAEMGFQCDMGEPIAMATEVAETMSTQ